MKGLHVLLLNLILALAWGLGAGELNAARLLEGFILGFLALWVTGRIVGANEYGRRTIALVRLILFFIKELLVANLRVAYDVLTPTHHMKPGVITIPLDVKTDAEITLLGNLISLTPGTLTLDVSPDHKTLYIHAMYIEDVEQVRRQIKEGLERRILEVTR